MRPEEQLHFHITRNVRRLVPRFKLSVETIALNEPSIPVYQHHLVAKFSYIRDLYVKEDYISDASKLMVRQFKRDLYGDLIDLVYKTKQNIYESNEKDALDCLDEILSVIL